MKKIAFLLISMICLATAGLHAQIMRPVKWQFSIEKISGNDYYFIAKAAINKPWHVYSQHIGDGGPIPTKFTFTASPDYVLKGAVDELGKVIELKDPNFDMVLKYYEDKMVCRQRITLKKDHATVSGKLEYMTCNDSQCLPPEEVPFSMQVGEGASPGTTTPAPQDKPTETKPDKMAQVDSGKGHTDTAAAPVVAATSAKEDDADLNTADNLDNKSLWEVILAGFGAGLISLLMPCVWPIIPLTVSFFLKQSKDKPGKGRANALLYGVSIMTIFVLLGVIVSFFTSSQELNALSTNWFFNLLFFVN
jgi:thiol:disulfide interchange protein DsbD